jgi:hypothetical protein
MPSCTASIDISCVCRVLEAISILSVYTVTAVYAGNDARCDRGEIQPLNMGHVFYISGVILITESDVQCAAENQQPERSAALQIVATFTAVRTVPGIGLHVPNTYRRGVYPITH